MYSKPTSQAGLECLSPALRLVLLRRCRLRLLLMHVLVLPLRQPLLESGFVGSRCDAPFQSGEGISTVAQDVGLFAVHFGQRLSCVGASRVVGASGGRTGDEGIVLSGDPLKGSVLVSVPIHYGSRVFLIRFLEAYACRNVEEILAVGMNGNCNGTLMTFTYSTFILVI